MFHKSLAFASAALMAISPTLAQASAAPPQAAPVERAGAEPGDQALTGGDGSWIAQGLFGVIVILGILMATGIIFDDDDPVSP